MLYCNCNAHCRIWSAVGRTDHWNVLAVRRCFVSQILGRRSSVRSGSCHRYGRNHALASGRGLSARAVVGAHRLQFGPERPKGVIAHRQLNLRRLWPSTVGSSSSGCALAQSSRLGTVHWRRRRGWRHGRRSNSCILTTALLTLHANARGQDRLQLQRRSQFHRQQVPQMLLSQQGQSSTVYRLLLEVL